MDYGIEGVSLVEIFPYLVGAIAITAGAVYLARTLAASKRCPTCIGRVNRRAVKCRHCGEALPED